MHIICAGLGIAGRITNAEGTPKSERAYLEGGDFFPAGENLALLGIGLRTTYAAAKQLMEKDLLGTTRFAVVRDELDQNQDRMHLDCVFSILSDDCCLMLETITGVDSPQRRLVDLWEQKVDKEGRLKYQLTKENTGIEFAAFMQVRFHFFCSQQYEVSTLPQC
jgi:arginine deiminase